LIQPTSSFERIPALDFLRGVAILGILFINAENFAYPDSFSPWRNGFEEPRDYTTRFWVYFLTQGKFYNMFALLFGVGFYIFLDRLEKKQAGLRAMDIYARRLLWLFVIGAVHYYFVWDGDILHHYAICGFLLFPFRAMKGRSLLVVMGLLMALQLVKAYDLTLRRQGWKVNYERSLSLPEEERTEDDEKRIAFWERLTQQKAPDTTQVPPRKETFLRGLQETYESAGLHKGEVFHQGLLYPTLLIMLAGMLLYRSGIFHNYRAWRYYWPVSLTVLGVGLLVNYLRFYHWTYQYFDPVTNIWKGWLFTFPKELLGLGYILFFNGVYQKLLKTARFKIISNVGKTALSNYILQNILLGLVFYGYGLGQFNHWSRFEVLGIVALIWVIQLALSALWLRKYPQGPLERLWRRLTYRSFEEPKAVTK